jgi:hypothetical protein
VALLYPNSADSPMLAMIGFDDIVQILDRSMHRFLRTFAFGLQLRNCDPVGRRLVRVDDLRLLPILQTVQRLAEEALRRFGVPCRREIEIDRVSMLVDGPVQIGPFSANLHISLIDPSARRSRATPLPAQPLFDLRRVILNPTVDRGMIDAHAVLAHHLLEITIADPIPAVPTHRPKDDLAFKMTPFEI